MHRSAFLHADKLAQIYIAFNPFSFVVVFTFLFSAFSLVVFRVYYLEMCYSAAKHSFLGFSWLFVCNCTCYCQTLISAVLLNCTTLAFVVLASSPLYCSSISLCPWRSNKQRREGTLLLKAKLASERITAAAIMKPITIIHLTEAAVVWKLKGAWEPYYKAVRVSTDSHMRGGTEKKKSVNDKTSFKLLNNWLAYSCGQ